MMRDMTGDDVRSQPAAAAPQPPLVAGPPPQEGLDRVTLAIASSTFIASLSVLFWVPFLPLYAQELGATSNADALFWVAIANFGLGIGRLVSGPLWGVLAD